MVDLKGLYLVKHFLEGVRAWSFPDEKHMVSLKFHELFWFRTESGSSCVWSPFLNQGELNSGSNNDNLSSSSDESEDSDSLSNASDDELQNLFDSDNEEDDFAGFDVNLPDDIHWGNVWFESAINDFQLTPGPTINLPDSGRAIDFFMLFLWTDQTNCLIYECQCKGQRREKLAGCHRRGNESVSSLPDHF